MPADRESNEYCRGALKKGAVRRKDTDALFVVASLFHGKGQAFISSCQWFKSMGTTREERRGQSASRAPLQGNLTALVLALEYRINKNLPTKCKNIISMSHYFLDFSFLFKEMGSGLRGWLFSK
jgi:hypothetical protein